ncbi:MAG: class I SAM-dependent methyltransferase [Chloroflexi bacterium]|nr:class I SAM-dependent methyltransferase [Chloroflexota bacterium]
MKPFDDARRNRAHWDRESDTYQETHGPQLNTRACAWGVWALPEDELRVLGDVGGKDILELGCGAAQWSIFLARRGARPVGLDNSARQLHHARRLMAAAGVDFPLLHASAEAVPLADERFDVVFCDHGAISFADPAKTVPEAARLLRPDGLLAFNLSSPFISLCWNEETDRVEEQLRTDYFGLGRYEDGDHVEYQLPYGEWIRLFRRHGLVVEDLIELRPPAGAPTTYDLAPNEWARRWPAENIWKARKA